MRNAEQQKAWDLCQDKWQDIVDRQGENPTAADFTDTEFVVVAVWTVCGIVGNGGFEYLFEGDLPGDPSYRMSLKAFRAIGSDQAADAFEAALALFPGGNAPQDCVERDKAFRSTPEDARDQLNSRFWDADDEIVGRLAAFIRTQF